MKTLKIEHLAPYLPYGLKYIDKDSGEITTMRTISAEVNLIDLGWGNAHELKEFKPILRPLSDLTKEIEHNGGRFVPIDFFEIGDDYDECVDYGAGNVKLIGLLEDMAKYNFIDLPHIQFGVVSKFIEWHFDIHKLIDANLAIDINTLKS